MPTMKELESELIDAVRKTSSLTLTAEEALEVLAQKLNLAVAGKPCKELLDIWRNLPDPVTERAGRLYVPQTIAMKLSTFTSDLLRSARDLVFQKGFLRFPSTQILVWRYLCTGDEVLEQLASRSM